MNRRRFLQLLCGASVAAVAAEAIPFNRVWSFPSKVRLYDRFAIDYVQADTAMRFEPKFYGQSSILTWWETDHPGIAVVAHSREYEEHAAVLTEIANEMFRRERERLVRELQTRVLGALIPGRAGLGTGFRLTSHPEISVDGSRSLA